MGADLNLRKTGTPPVPGRLFLARRGDTFARHLEVRSMNQARILLVAVEVICSCGALLHEVAYTPPARYADQRPTVQRRERQLMNAQ